MIVKNKNLKSLKNIILMISLMFLTLSVALQDNITVNANDSCNVRGFTVGGNTVYGADVYWEDNMVFVFDRGILNENEPGSLVSFFGEDGEITKDMVEKGATSGEVGKWYGFDGVRNRILILNRSNANIVATYNLSLDEENTAKGAAKLELYDYGPNANGGYLVELATKNSDLVNAYDPQDGYLYDDNDKIDRFGNNIKLDNSNNRKILKAAPGDGTMYANKIFVNVTGTPTENFSTRGDDNSILGSLGRITITFNKV